MRMMLGKFMERVKNRKVTNQYLERDFNRLVRENSKYKNLDEKNKKVVYAIVKKYRKKIQEYQGITSYNIRNEMYRLHRKRIKENLTEEDLKDIKEILEMFRK